MSNAYRIYLSADCPYERKVVGGMVITQRPQYSLSCPPELLADPDVVVETRPIKTHDPRKGFFWQTMSVDLKPLPVHKLRRADCSRISDAEESLWDFLRWYHCGEKRAITAQTLAETREENERELTQMVHNLRSAGFLVVAGAGGYFVPESQEEKERYLRRERGRILELLQVYNRLKRSPAVEELKVLEAQEAGRMF